MSKLKKLVLTTAALAALAIGGAALAQAQNSGVAAQVPTTQSASDVLTPGDTPDAARAGDQSDPADTPDSATEQANEKADPAESDGSDGEHADDGHAGASHDIETND